MTGKDWAKDPDTEKLRDALKRIKIEFSEVLPEVIRILMPVALAAQEAGKEILKFALAKPKGPKGDDK